MQRTTSITHVVEYLALRLLQSLLSLLPRPIALRIGVAAGDLLYRIGVRRDIARKNMALVGIGEPERTLRDLYRTMGRYAVDFLRPAAPLPDYRTHNAGTIEALQKNGRGAIVLLAHFGNWELLADLFGSQVKSLHVVAKHMKNPLVDAWLAQKRKAASVTTIYMENALRKIYAALKNNDLVAILIDQRAGGGQGTPALFLGRETATVRTVAGLVHKTGCGVMPTYAIMRPDGSYDIALSTAAPPDFAGNNDDEAIALIQAQHNEIIGSWIREYPTHWFGWFHKRFREQVRY